MEPVGSNEEKSSGDKHLFNTVASILTNVPIASHLLCLMTASPLSRIDDTQCCNGRLAIAYKALGKCCADTTAHIMSSHRIEERRPEQVVTGLKSGLLRHPANK